MTDVREFPESSSRPYVPILWFGVKTLPLGVVGATKHSELLPVLKGGVLPGSSLRRKEEHL